MVSALAQYTRLGAGRRHLQQQRTKRRSQQRRQPCASGLDAARAAPRRHVLGRQAAPASSGVPGSQHAAPATRLAGSCAARPAPVPSRLRLRIVCAAAAAAAAAGAAPAANPLVASAAVLVGWLVIAGSCIRSLPQIIRILKNKSVRGLSLTSFSSELFCYMVSVAYNVSNGYAFSTYGDTAICSLQNAAIIGLIFWLGAVPRTTQLLLGAALTAAGWVLFSGACPPALLAALQTGSVALLALGGRLPQILLNLQRGNSGELSLLSCGLSFAGNVARVFTTATLVRDPIILGSAATQAVLNGILTWQCFRTMRQQQAERPPPEDGRPAIQPA